MHTLIRTLLTLALALLTLAAIPVAAPAAGLPDLKVTVLTTSTSTVVAGDQVTITDVTKNAGSARAGASHTRYYLSTDRSWNTSDRVLGTREVPRLGPDAKHRGSKTVVVPTTVAPGAQYVLACADARKAVKESRESNNCRATADQLMVTAPGGAGTFPMEPDPLTVGSTLQAARAITQTAYPVIDNVIEATAADGTTYTLTIPKDALLSAEDITMTPVASVSGMPLSGGLVAAVQIEPHGLMLLKPATLEIVSPDAGPVAQQTPFLFSAGGADFHQYPVALPEAGDTANTIRMHLHHFSTPGAGLATPGDRAGLSARVPMENLAQLESAVAEMLRAERASVQAGNAPNPDVMLQVVDLFNAYYDDVLRNQLQQAETDPQKAAQATAEAVGWMRQLALLNIIDSARITEAKMRIEKIWKYAMLFYWNRCLGQHDLNAIATLMGIARQAQIFGWSWGDEAKDKAERCGQLELRFDSAISASFTTSGSVSTHVRNSNWRVKSTTAIPWTGVGESSLGYTAFASSYRIDYHEVSEDCPVRYHVETAGSTTPGRLTALVQLQLNPRILPPGIEPVLATVKVFPAMSLTTPASQPEETYNWESHGCDGTTTGTDTRSDWLGSFAQLRSGNTTISFEIKAGGAGEVLATKTWTHDVGSGSGQTHLTEQTVIELWHKPLS